MFVHYRQINSRGVYLINDMARVNVIIEAETPMHSWNRAIDLGLDFSNNAETDCSEKNHCGFRWPIFHFKDQRQTASPLVYGLPIIQVPNEDKYTFWADTVVHYYPNPKDDTTIRSVYGYGPDIYRNGIPVPPTVAELLKSQGMTLGREIKGGGWRVGYADSNGLWRLATPLNWASYLYDRVRTKADATGVQFIAGVPV